MFQTIRKSRFTKVLVSYLTLQLLLMTIQPFQLMAMTGGPSQPEFNAFTPIGTSDMVNLSSGDFNYNIPIMDVGGYPINLAYDSGISMDQEASWVGLGWNLNVGQINRDVRGIPDDFKGDEMIYENDLRENVTVGSSFSVRGSLFGLPSNTGLSLGLGVQYNNYNGITFHPTYGISFGISDNVQVGLNISSSTADGVNVSPSASISTTKTTKDGESVNLSNGLGLSMNSRKGLSNLSVSGAVSKSIFSMDLKNRTATELSYGASNSSYLSFNNNNIFTPLKRAGYANGNFSFSGSLGAEVVGVEVDGVIQGYGSFQKIRNDEKRKLIPAYGYLFSEFAEKGNSVLDFNREKDRSFDKKTTILPIVNNTYDIYSIKGQGVSGMFRPHRSQVSYLSDNKVQDFGDGISLGIEFGAGWNVHTGFDAATSPSYSYTGGWEDGNFALSRFEETDVQNLGLYRPVYDKIVGEPNVDAEPELFSQKLGGNSPIRLNIGGGRYNRTLLPEYEIKTYNNSGIPSYGTSVPVSSKIKRTKRNFSNTSIITVTNDEARLDGLVRHRSSDSRIKNHHTAGKKILKSDGSTYVYGETAYNWTKDEITVDASGSGGANCADGTINNTGSVNSNNSSDKYKNIIRTPAYAHSYLLSSVLSADYEDLTNNGPSIDDLGSYTLFNYGSSSTTPDYYVSNYNWRTPFEFGKANYNEGLKSLNNDQKASIIKGTKELRYIRTVDTKTHVAYFMLSDREDGQESSGNDHMKKIDKIFLYSRPEYNALVDQYGNLDTISDLDILSKSAIKVAHFEYDYTLCPDIPNGPEGKLTLKEVYFTYRGSNLGKYTPYIFNYDGFNPSYNLKGYDIWGNYKENFGDNNCSITSPLTTSEFPFVDQDKEQADMYSNAWMLTSIDLPSGGKLEVETEADDYQYVQDRKAMQMFKLRGFGFDKNPLSGSDSEVKQIYNGSDHKPFLYVKISEDELSEYQAEDFLNDYLEETRFKPIYFRALLNMALNTNTKYDYVTGYFEIADGSGINDFGVSSNESGTYASIPLEFLEKEGGILQSTNQEVNPIAKAGWYFGRTNLNRLVFSAGGDAVNDDFTSIVNDLLSSIGTVFEIFSGPNTKLQEKQIARNIIPEKSWIRLENPNKRKYGGGVRVKKIVLNDQWDLMDQTTSNDGNDLYKQFYGQEYSYNLEDGSSSGVASFEPNGSKENPFVEPFYDAQGNGKDQLVSPAEFNYVEKPIGESFFPSAAVTYSRIEVKNLERENPNENLIISKHGTGKVITEFYTSKDFPTITDHTEIKPLFDPPGRLSNFLNLSVKNHLTFSQGFVVETNDMNGRMKSQRVFPESQDDDIPQIAISGVDYYYNSVGDRTSSSVSTINRRGEVSEQEVGLTYDVYNDFRENYSQSETFGIDYNVAGFVVFIVPVIVPMPIPDVAYHETKLRTASTTKVIHRTAIQTKKVAFDLGSQVSTENIAWDAETGQVLLTKTVNEFDDHYFNFTYPSYWKYEGMDQANRNIGAEGVLTHTAGDDNTNNKHFFRLQGSSGNSNAIFRYGDEIRVKSLSQDIPTVEGTYWVVDLGPTNLTGNSNQVALMNRQGEILNYQCSDLIINSDFEFKIVRSGYRNQQMASMASITTQVNPIDINNDGNLNNLTSNSFIEETASVSGLQSKIVNANAVAYKDFWEPQDEQALPKFPTSIQNLFEEANSGSDVSSAPSIPAENFGFNPYVYNVLGDWRAVNSYAYLTGRNIPVGEGSISPRNEGFFTEFTPYYSLNLQSKWEITPLNWTFASKVSKYSPYGAELENVDALNRYSSAQYGYNYTLPTAVASNSKYSQIGFDGFEDYQYNLNNTDEINGHFNFLTNSDLITNEESHTGRSSIKVIGGSDVILSNNLSISNYEIEQPDDCSPVDPVEECSSSANTAYVVRNYLDENYEDDYRAPVGGNVSVTRNRTYSIRGYYSNTFCGDSVVNLALNPPDANSSLSTWGVTMTYNNCYVFQAQQGGSQISPEDRIFVNLDWTDNSTGEVGNACVQFIMYYQES